MSRRKVLCPYCFETINLSEAPFLCENRRCEEEARKKNRIASFSRPSIPLLERMGIWAPPDELVHTDCGEMSHIRLCPKCLEVLPRDIEKFTDCINIAIIGHTASGKSCYIAMLIKRIQELGLDYDWSLYPVNDATMNNYQMAYRQPLFKNHLIVSTRESIHLVYALYTKRRKKVLIVFNDFPGEVFVSSKDLKSKYNNYICNASGIICIVDPLQLSSVRNIILAKHDEQEFHTVRAAQSGQIMDVIINLIREGSAKNAKGKIQIPFAVALSKMDFIKDAGENASRLYGRIFEESRHKKSFDKEEFENIDSMVRAWLSEVEAKDIVSKSNAFKPTGFFGFSALGCNPLSVNAKEPALDREPISCRVEDPFLWILKQNKII